MNSTLERRVGRLEQGAGSNAQSMVVHWQFSEATKHLTCAGQNFTRQAEESLSAFTDRAAEQVAAAAPDKILWMGEMA